MKSTWKRFTSKIVHKNPWYYMRQDKVLTPFGKPGFFNVVVKSPAAFVVAMNNKNEIAFIKLYRYPTQMYSLEIPAGGVEKHESPLQAAKRELQEETSLVARHWQKLGTMQIANGCMNQIGHIFLATELTKTRTNKCAKEGITKVQFIALDKAHNFVKCSKISDSQSITSLTLAALRINI